MRLTGIQNALDEIALLPGVLAPVVRLRGEVPFQGLVGFRFGGVLAQEIAEVQAAKVALREKHRAGEIDDDVYDTEFDALQDRKSALVTGQALAEQRAELNTAFADQSWAYVQRQFLASPDNAALLQKPLLFSTWEAAMQTVVNQAAEQRLQLSDWDIMAHARKMLADEG